MIWGFEPFFLAADAVLGAGSVASLKKRSLPPLANMEFIELELEELTSLWELWLAQASLRLGCCTDGAPFCEISTTESLSSSCLEDTD